jgi:hypothetical protein
MPLRHKMWLEPVCSAKIYLGSEALRGIGAEIAVAVNDGIGLSKCALM